MRSSRFLTSIVAAAAGLSAISLVAALLNYSPLAMLRGLYDGSVGSTFGWQATLLETTPLLLTGLSVAVAFQAGVWNIGAEGQFVAGAVCAFLAARFGLVAAVAAGIAGGSCSALIATGLRLWRNAPEVLSTILLNFVAVELLGWCVNGPLQESAKRYPQSDLADAALPEPGIGAINVGLLLAAAAALFCWWFLYRSIRGLRTRAAGMNPDALRWMGLPVQQITIEAMALSGGLAGLAGALQLLGVTHRLYDSLASGYGYSGIAVALLAQLHPLGCGISALLFGALTAGAGELQRSEGLSSSIAVLAQAVVILTLLASTRRSGDA